jgi:PAS domain-containing protein
VGTRPHRAARLTETRERLLTSAETLFPVRGFEAISVRDLATAAHCSVCEDITESKRAEKTLRESEEGFRRMAEILTEALWIMALQLEQILVWQSER